MIRNLVLATLGAGSLALTGGCLVLSGSSTTETGVLVSASTIQQVEIGATTEQWLLATLGEPTDRHKVDGRDNVEILRYEFVREESSGGMVFLVFAGGSDHTSRSVAYFELTDKVVTRAWREAYKGA